MNADPFSLGACLLFIDTRCVKPYADQTLAMSPMGGSEATLIRIAGCFAGSVVMQHNRRLPAGLAGVRYQPLDWTRLPPGPIVVMRDPDAAIEARRRAPHARVLLWLHDLIDHRLLLAVRQLHQNEVELVFVSQFHRRLFIESALGFLGQAAPFPALHVIHNPVSDDLVVENRDFDPDRLVFLSSPHKGVRETVEAFVKLRRTYPRLELHIANPGYHPDVQLEMPGLRVLGALAQPKAIEAARGALCLFYPNHSYPETFGIVFAEANAIGVPALAHDFGAAREVLGDDDQVLNCRNFEAISARIELWRNGGRPVVSGRPDLRLSHIAKQWRDMLA